MVAVDFTLTMAADLVRFEPNYSSGTDKQVFKRTHNFGQRHSCTIWKLVAIDSLDEKDRSLSLRPSRSISRREKIATKRQRGKEEMKLRSSFDTTYWKARRKTVEKEMQATRFTK